MLVIVDNTGEDRLETTVDGQRAELVYHRNGPRLVIVHTAVPEAIAGRGIGGRLVAAAVEKAARDGLTLVPNCPFARSWLGNHLDVAGASIDWGDGRPPARSKTGPRLNGRGGT